MNVKKEIKRGYKMTKLGWIPVEWEVIGLKGVCAKLINGGTPSRKKTEYWNGTIPWISGADILNQEVSAIRRRITKEAIENSSTNLIKKGDILIVTRTGVGKLAIAPFDICISQDFTGVIPNLDIINTEFLFIFLDFSIPKLKCLNQGTSINGITRDVLIKHKIPLPPLPEQKKIAQILSTWDRAIHTLERLISKKQELKKGLMQVLLTGKVRFGEFVVEEGMRETKLGWLPRDWEVKRLSEIAEIKGGKRIPKGKSLSDEKTPYPYIRVADMFNGGVKINQVKYVPEDVFPIISRYTISEKDIFITVAGTLGIVGTVPASLDGANLTENADKLTNLLCDRDYLLFVLMSSIVQKHIKAEQTSNAQPKLALTRIRKFFIPYPSLKEQKRISTLIIKIQKEIDFLENEFSCFQTQKKGLMQKLLTGEVRVKV
ncbi:MAG TPA: restriction endonuclease subunit S [Bacteroidetes bacterium]|nr:restriction endonuclease subunit S [Bacteroidota bacterium]